MSGTMEEAAPATGDGHAGPAPRRSRAGREALLLAVTALLLALLIKTFLLQAFFIPSVSMQNTLQVGDRVVVDKLTPWFGAEPKRGEVVVFRDPGGWLSGQPTAGGNPVTRGVRSALSTVGLLPADGEGDLIKRVIAVGGDRVTCVASGPVKVNGVPLAEPYVYPGATPCDDRPAGTVTVPAGHLWVMGDHRNESADSRFHRRDPGGGFVPLDDVVGRAVLVIWPFGHWHTLSVPGTFQQAAIHS